jgi:adenylate kinase
MVEEKNPKDREVKDAQLIFDAVWADLTEKFGRDHLRFPREFIWLGGAPGAGKGTNTPFIAEARGITAAPVVISSLLTTPEAVAIKNAGGMVGDREVIRLLLEELLKEDYYDGVIVDGFPRTKVQVECLKLLHDYLLKLHDDYRSTELARFFRKPQFRIVILFVNEKVSVQRQKKRGQDIHDHNQKVLQTGVGTLLDERATDIDEDLCRKRYLTFTNTTFDALSSLRQLFHYYYIDAEGDLDEVHQNILKELSYQSSLELSQEVFEVVRDIPEASQLRLHARQELVERLESYQEDHAPLFQKVAQLLEEKMIPVVRAHSISGHARINTEDELLDDPLALRMMIDILSERGFHASVDIHRMDVPERINPETWEILCRTKKVYRIEVRYPPSDIRRGH